MSVDTSVGLTVSESLLCNYFDALVNQVYKILPMREHNSKTLEKYIWRLNAEIIGGSELYPHFGEDSYYASLINILQYLGNHCSDDTIEQTRQLVFEGISLCEKLKARYTNDDKNGDSHERMGRLSE